jgi:hypothetical protein
LCPGETFFVPYTVGNRANDASEPKEHHMGFYMGDFNLIPDELLGAIVDNEMEFDSTNTQIVSNVQQLALSADPDCTPPGTYYVWHRVDICQQILEGNENIAGGPLEGDNTLRTGLQVEILAPSDPICSGLGLPTGDGMCNLQAFACPPPVKPPPKPPVECPEAGCGTEQGALCLNVGLEADGSVIGVDDPLHWRFHPDGSASATQYCLDDPDNNVEMVCSGEFVTCEVCGQDGQFWPGCECNPNFPDSCGGGDLTCFPSTGYNENGPSRSTGRCWSVADGPPDWECQADCHAIYGDLGYCYHGALPGGQGAGTPICANANCALNGVPCAEQGLFCNVDTDECVNECNGEIHDPDNGLFSCEGRGYPPGFACDLASQRCFVDGVPHP